MPQTIGIDLGASFSSVAYMDKARKEAKCIPGPYGGTLCPSIVALDADGSIIVGAPARRRSLSHAESGIGPVKHRITQGTDEVSNAPRTDARVDAEGRETVGIRLGEGVVTPPEISAFILRELRTWAEVFLGEPVNRAVIAVPAYFDEAQRQSTKEAGSLAGLELVRLVHEPAAAALAYGLHEQRRVHVAVYDLGGSRFQISILKLMAAGEGEIYQVVSTNGDASLGGNELDDVLLGVAREEIRVRHAVDVLGDPHSLQALRRAVVRAKHDLSSADRASLELPLPNRSVYLREMGRAEFEGLVQPILERTMDPLRIALADAKLNAGDIDEVVLVGGTTRVPLVQRMVGQFFDRRPRAEINPDEVVALGAAVQADILESGASGAEAKGRAAPANV